MSQVNRLKIQLQQLKADNQALTRSNQHYMQQVSRMEVEISELKAKISSYVQPKVGPPSSTLQSQLEDAEAQLRHELMMRSNFEKRFFEAQHKLQQLDAQQPEALQKQLEDALLDNEVLKTHYIPKLHADLQTATHRILELEAKLRFLQTAACNDAPASKRSIRTSGSTSKLPRPTSRIVDYVPSYKRPPRTSSKKSFS